MFKVGDKVRLSGIRNPDNYWSEKMVEMEQRGGIFSIEMAPDALGVMIDGWIFFNDEICEAEAQETLPVNELIELRRTLKKMVGS